MIIVNGSGWKTYYTINIWNTCLLPILRVQVLSEEVRDLIAKLKGKKFLDNLNSVLIEGMTINLPAVINGKMTFHIVVKSKSENNIFKIVIEKKALILELKDKIEIGKIYRIKGILKQAGTSFYILAEAIEIKK